MPIEIMVVAIVSVVMFAAVAKQWLRTREAQAPRELPEEVLKKLERVDKLEERIRVLEKVITNRKVKLADEIENL